MDDIRDIKPPVPPGGPAWPARSPGLGLLVLGVLGALAVWRWRRLRPAAAATRRLRRDLARLETGAAALDDREFHERLAGILRRGLALRLGPEALTLATEELPARLDAADLPAALGTAVAEALRRCDLTRFAGTTEGPRTPRTADLATARRLLGGRRPW